MSRVDSFCVTCLNCDGDVDGGPVDVRRATCGSRAQGKRFSACHECMRTGHTSAYRQPIGVPRAVRKPRRISTRQQTPRPLGLRRESKFANLQTGVRNLSARTADRCSLEYHSSSMHTAVCCCAAAYSPRRARALQASSERGGSRDHSVQDVWRQRLAGAQLMYSPCRAPSSHTNTHTHRCKSKCALWIDCMTCDSQARHRPVW